VELFAFPHGDGPGALTAGRVEVAAIRIADALPAQQPVRAGPHREGELADDMLVTGAGLWIASDNLDGTDRCGGVGGHAGICFLPYTS